MDKFIETTLKIGKQLDKQLKSIKMTEKMMETPIKIMNDLAVAENIEKNMTIGERIKQLRKQEGLKQSELAEKSNLNRVTILNYEKGKRKASIDVIAKIAAAFNMSTNEFLRPCEEDIVSPKEKFKNNIVEFLQETNLKDKLNEEDITALQNKVIDLIEFEIYKKSH